MKKKVKLFASLASLCIALAVLCFGVYSARTVNYSLNGNVTYTVEDAFVEVQTKLYKSTTNLTRSQLGQKVNAVADMDFATVPEGLTIVDTSEVYRSINGSSGTYENTNLKFSTKAGEECYAYFFVINIKNLSSDVNVWAVMEDELTDPANTIQINNQIQQTIDTNGKNMVIGLSVDDLTQNIPTANNAYSYGIKIGAGTYALSEVNLNKLTLTLDETNNTYSVKAKDTSVKGIVVIPEQYSEGIVNRTSNVNLFSNAPTVIKSVGNIETKAFEGCSQLTSITIPSSVTSIGNYAFYGCTGLTEVTISIGVTSIGNYAFYGCTGLTEVTIPSSVTSLGQGVFNDCTGLTEVTILSGVTSIGILAFYNCTALTSIQIPSSVTSIGREAFKDCCGVENITVDLSNTTYRSEGNCLIERSTNKLIFGCKSSVIPSSVTSIGSYAFSSCTGLTEVIIPRSVTSIGNSAFFGCTGLTSIEIPSNVTSIEQWAFYGCTGVTEVTIQNGLTTIGDYVFQSCANLTSIVIPSSVTSIGKYAFSNCTMLNSIIIKDGVASIGDYAFSGCTGVTEVTFENCLTSIGNYAFQNCNSLTSIIIPKILSSIGEYAFSGCTNLTQAIIQNGLTSIGYKAFSGCTGLTEVIIPRSVTSIGSYAFSGCTNITEVTIPGSVTSIGDYVFSDCTGLTTVIIENGVTTIGDCEFRNCESLTTIEIPSSVTSIGDNLFENCKSLTSITIPSGVTSIGNSVFSGCAGLASIEIPSNVTKIGMRAFSGCTSLTEITVPSGVTNLGGGVFYNCTGLKSVIIEGVTSIGNDTFGGCKGLTEIRLPSSLTGIGGSAFYNCTGLKLVYYKGSEEDWNKIGGTGNISSATIYYYSDCIHGESERLWRLVDGKPSTQPTVNEWIIDKEATVDESGHKHGVCSVCDTTINKDYYLYTIKNDEKYAWTNIDGILVSGNKRQNSSSSTYTITAEGGAVTVSFEHKVSSEKDYDKLTIKKNTETLVNEISGTTEYAAITVTLQKGESLTITYSKDITGASGDDRAYIKGLTITAA